jgi:DNA-binding transcriptional ArsR family regulator
MTRLSLKARLANYFRNNHSMWISSGDLQRIVMQTTSYTAQNVGRRLRELENEGVLEVEYRKNHAYYRARIGKRLADCEVAVVRNRVWA